MMVKKSKHLIKTKYGSFLCIFEAEKDMGGYVAEALEVRGAVSWGKTLAEARRMIADAIEGAIEASVIAKAEQAGSVRIVRNASRIKA